MKIEASVLLAAAFFIASCAAAPRPIAHAAVTPSAAPASSGRNLHSPELFRNDINAFIEMDKTNFPPPNAVLFMGSSSIRMWDVKRYFPGLAVINRGFGGSYIYDSGHYADTIAAPYKPRLVVLYAGDNDIADGKQPTDVASDFNYFLGSLRAGLPNQAVIVITIKPTPARWGLWPQMQETNKLIKNLCETQQPCRVLNVVPEMLGRDGKPRPELFRQDGLHMTDQGYTIWSNMLKPLLKQ